MALSLLLQLLVLSFLWIVVLKRSLLDPVIVFFVFWFVPLILVQLGIFKYDNYLTHDSFNIVMSSLWAFSIGALLFLTTQRFNTLFSSQSPICNLWKQRWWKLLLLFMVLSYMLSVGLALNQKADLLQGQLDVSSLRNLHWADYGGGQSHFLGFLKTISRPFNILNAIGLVFYRSRAISRSSAGLSGVSLLLLTLDTLGEGGRGLIVFVGIVMLYSLFFIQFNGNLKITKIFSWVNVSVGLRIGLIVVLGLLAFGVWFPVARNPNLSRNFNYFFERRAGVIVTDLGWELENVLGNNIYAVLTSLSYFTNPISTLTFYYRFSDFENWYYLGQYSFPLVSKPVDLVMGNDYSWFQIRQRLSLVPASMGLADNPWATGLRGLLVDFGEIGTVIFLFILGFLSEFMFQKASLYPSDLNIFVLAIFCGLIFVFPLYEFFHSGYFTLPLLIILPISLFQTKG